MHENSLTQILEPVIMPVEQNIGFEEYVESDLALLEIYESTLRTHILHQRDVCPHLFAHLAIQVGTFIFDGAESVIWSRSKMLERVGSAGDELIEVMLRLLLVRDRELGLDMDARRREMLE